MEEWNQLSGSSTKATLRAWCCLVGGTLVPITAATSIYTFIPLMRGESLAENATYLVVVALLACYIVAATQMIVVDHAFAQKKTLLAEFVLLVVLTY